MTGHVKKFPAGKLARVSRSEITLAGRVDLSRLQTDIQPAAAAVASALGLGGVEIRLQRVQGLALEDLPGCFPGHWRFGVLVEPIANRQAFVALDGVLLRRLADMLGRRPPPEPLFDGLHGLAAAVFALLLQKLSENPGGEHFANWRWAGLVDSAGEMGRLCLHDNSLVGVWLTLDTGWDKGFLVWLEPDCSCNRAGRARPDPAGQLPAPALERLQRLELEGGLQLGRCSLDAAELAQLRRGDILLLAPGERQSPYRWQVGQLTLLLNPEAGGLLRVQGFEFQRGGDDMEAGQLSDGDLAPSCEPVEIPRLPVTLSVECGRVRMSISRLAKLRAGDVLEMPEAVLAPVQVRAGNQLLANGELVDVEGRRGVRLLEVFVVPGDGHD